MNEQTKHVVMFSGGAGSFGAAWRVAQRHGRSALTLLFTDTLEEDEDSYRFIVESAAWLTGNAGRGEVSGLVQLAAQTPPVWEYDARKSHLVKVRTLAAQILPSLVWVAEGRSIWEVFRDERFLGNSRVGLCTRTLKQEMANAWMDANCDPASTVRYIGIDWSESHRFDRLAVLLGDKGWRVEAPMCEPPYVTKMDVLAHLRGLSIRPPRLYDYGFAHANCGGGCVKAGIGHFALLHRALPEVFAHWERQEEALRAQLGDVSILSDRRGGPKKPLPLATLRARLEAGQSVDLFEIGGCGCFVDTEAA